MATAFRTFGRMAVQPAKAARAPAIPCLITQRMEPSYLDVEHDSDSNGLNNPWTLFLPDGGRVTSSSTSERIYDRNNNYIEVVDGTYQGHTATYLNDQVGHSIIIEYESATNQDSIHVTGYNNAALTTTVAWTNVEVHKTYSREVGTPFNLPATWRSVSQITLPSQAGSLSYNFGYNANGSNPTVGWGELNSITLPSASFRDFAIKKPCLISPSVMKEQRTEPSWGFINLMERDQTAVTEL